MLSKKTWLSIYAILFALFSASLITVSAEDRRMALTEIFKAFGSEEPEETPKETAIVPTISVKEDGGVFLTGLDSKAMMALTTIIQGADEEVGCSTNGFTVARFNLCGDFDDRVITLSGSHSTVNWQLLGGSCTPDINDDCPDTTTSCYTTVHTGASFTLDASTISATSGAEFRAVVDGTPYYFKVKKSTISQTYVKNDFICGVPGRIQITNLSSAYEFSIDNGSGFGPWQGPIFDNLTPGTYIVKARLQNIPNTCEYPYEPITIEQRDIDIDVSFVDVLCFGETGSITVTAHNVPGPYKYTLLDENGVPQEFTAFIPDNPYTFSAVGFGTYTVQVETQQCTGDLLNGIDPPRQDRDTAGNPITIGGGITVLDASTEVNNSFGCANITSVDVLLNVTGGQPPYSYIVNGSGPSSAPFTGSVSHTVTAAGTYDFLITDSNGCTITASSDVEELLPPDITVSGVDGTCSNGGARLVFTSNDARGYNLSYRADSSDAWDSNNQLSVAAGTYNSIQVRYQQGGFECTLDMPSVTVTTVDVILGNAVKIADRSCDGSGGVDGGQIDFQGPFSGGSGSGYTFSIDGVNFTTTTSYTGLAPGTYTPMIEDGGGCRLELTPITVLDIDPPSDINFTQDNVNCAANTADVQLVPTANAAIVNYSIIAPTVMNNGGNDTFTGLDISTSYIFQITDANNCTYTEGFTPQLISSIRARVKSGGDLRVCTGASDGSGTFLIDGFANTYTYNINGGTESTAQNDTEIQITGLAVGTYTVTVTDTDSGCSDSASFDVLEPTTPLGLTGNVTPMSCTNNNLGRVVASATGGWGSYRYTLEYPGGAPVVGPKSGRTFGNLSAAGTYTLTVTDAEGCSATHTFTLTTINAPDIVLDSGASDICHIPGTGATVAVSSTAGSAPLASHQYRINGGTLQASPVFSGLTPGTYTIEVVDSNNCSDSINVTINPPLRANASIATEIPCGGAPGQIQVTVNGGYTVGAGTKQYEVSADGGTTFGVPSPLTSNSFLFDTNVPGDYVFRVTDNEGCVAESFPVTLNPPQTIDPATIDVTPVSCGGTDNGRVVITPDATSGIPPYEISFDGGAFGTQNVFSNLTVGTYQVVVRDARGCETTPVDAVVSLDTTAVPNATVSEVQATCNAGATSGGISIDSVADGSPNFIFIVEDAFGNEVTRLEDVDPATLPRQLLDPALVTGDYRVITLDANGCSDEDMVTITTNEVIIAPINFTPPITCDDTAFTYTVRVTPTIFPTVPTYQIRLAGQPAFYALNNNAGADTHEFSNTSDGIMYGVTYTVEVLAPNGCIYEQEIPPVEGPSTLDVTASSTPGFCDANRNGQISYSITGYTVGDQLQVQLINNDAGTTTAIETVTTTVDPHTNTVEDLPGNYQILVTNLSDTCTDAVAVTIDQNLPSIDILNLEPATCNSNGSFTVQGRGGAGGPFGYAFMDAGVTPTHTDFGTQTTFYGPAGTYDVYVRDSSGCTSFAIARIIPDNTVLPAPTFVVNNQCDPTSTSFDIVVRVPNTVDTPRFDLNGDEQFGVLNGSFFEHTYSVGTPGDYVVDVMDANGCTSQGTARVFEFLTASGGFTTESTCNANDGVITITANGGSGNFDYVLTGNDYNSNPVTLSQADNPVFTGMLPGTYQVEVTDRDVTDGTGNCTFTVNNIVLAEAIEPVLEPIVPQNISCSGANDGGINATLQAGTTIDSPFDFRLLDFDTRALMTNNATGSFSGLLPGRYEVEVISARGCTDMSGLLTIVEPVPFAISASAPDFACEPGANRFSSTTLTAVVDPVDMGTTGNYRFSISGFENYQTSPDFEIIDNGSVQNITVYAIDANGCQATATVTINPPTAVTSSIVENDALDCANPERVRIQVTGTNNFTVNTVSAFGVAPVTNVPGMDYVDVFLPSVGDYIFEIDDHVGGCTYPMPPHTVVSPESPNVIISEAKPVSCFTPGNDGQLAIEVTGYTGNYDYTVYFADDTAKVNPIASGAFNTATNPELISGLPGGNLVVEIRSVDAPFCSSDSNATTIRTPNGNLEVTAVELGNVGCNDTSGQIEATGNGGWDTAGYEFQLLHDDGDGAGFYVLVPYSTASSFDNLSSGDYRVEIRDMEGCTDTFDINLPIVPQINAGIREPQALVCPNGNTAVLEAYDPSTGDALTATAGASGGYPGAGYNYRLLYLNGNDNTDVASTGGLQDSPTFIGDSGGYLSGGWYAIEVSSSFECSFVTEPYFVNPPPPIEPKLVQTRVPGCGGDGQMRLFIENYDTNFTYEYRIVPTPDPLNDPYTDMNGSEVFITGVAGITYQYEVRKKNSLNTCLPVLSNGVTMTMATGVTLLPNQPDDISCASELDGRIESFVNGGVGDNEYYLYLGDPVDPFNPAPGANLIRGGQDHGTFEGLDAASNYYIAVTSGTTCFDVAGPFVVSRPAPIVVNTMPTPTTCVGNTDGTIQMEVVSGGEGWIQFAIGPHFNEFFSDPNTPGSYLFEDLAAGEYEVLIQDENGCFETEMVTVGAPTEIQVLEVQTTPETCIGFSDGTAQLTVTGGTPFVDTVTGATYYETKIIGSNPTGDEVFVRNDSLSFENLMGGEIYVVIIQDANFCDTDTVVSIEIGVDLTAETIPQYGCEGIFPNSTVTVAMQDTSLYPNLLFSLDVDDISVAGSQYTWGNLAPGTHTVYIYHSNGCYTFSDFTIEAYDPLTLTAIKTGPNEITATATGGYGDYEFFFEGNSTGSDNVYHRNESGTVEVRVVDARGCTARVSLQFVFDGNLELPDFFTPDGDGHNDEWFPRNTEYFPQVEVKIYDRYGRVVAILNKVERWDGTYEGYPMPTGDYWYEVNANNKAKDQWIGHFTLLR